MGISVFPAASAVAAQPIGTNGIVFAGNATQGSYTHPSSITPGNYLLYSNFDGTPLPDLSVSLPASGRTVDTSYNAVAPTLVTVTSTETALAINQNTITRWSTSSNFTTNMTRIAFGAGLYVVSNQGTTNNIWTSPDLITWTVRTSQITVAITGLAFGNGIFVAIGTNGAASSSTDGITWTSRTMGGSTLRDVVFGNGTFVAAGQNNVFTSTNGTTWTSQTNPTGGSDIFRLGFANGLFFNFSASGTSYYTSSTGAGGSWTGRGVTGAAAVRSVAFANGLYVIGNASTVNQVYTTTDLTNDSSWVGRTLSGATQNTYVVFANGRFIAVSGDRIYQSFDGFTWTQKFTLGDQSQQLQFINNNFVIPQNNRVSWNSIAGLPVQYALYRTAGANLN